MHFVFYILLFLAILLLLSIDDSTVESFTPKLEVPFKTAEPIFLQELVPLSKGLTSNKVAETLYDEPLPTETAPTTISTLYPTLPPPEGSPGQKQPMYRDTFTQKEIQQQMEGSDTTLDINPPEQVCILDHDHHHYISTEGKKRTSEWKMFCNYGVTNFSDPRTMNDFERRLYKLNYSNQFTLQDYINWLWLHKDPKDQESLTYVHLRNLKRLQHKKSIPNQVPFITDQPPLQGVDYYTKLYKDAANAPEKKAPLTFTLEQVSYMEDNYPNFLQSYQDYKQPIARGRDLNSNDIFHKEDAKALDDFIYGVMSVQQNTLQARNQASSLSS
jgi:hypothetical protein